MASLQEPFSDLCVFEGHQTWGQVAFHVYLHEVKFYISPLTTSYSN